MIKRIVLIGLILLGLASCSPSYYPQKLNTPLLREQGETKINVAGNVNSINIQASTAITENFAIATSFNGFLMGATNVTTSNGTTAEGGARGFQMDVMPGFYVPFNESAVIEIYGGFGSGISNSDEVSGPLHRFILQPSIGVAGDRFEFAFSSRLTHVRIPASAMLDDNPRLFAYTFLEPALIFRLGSEKLKFTTQIGFSLPIVNIPDDPNGNFIEWNPLILNMGLQFDLGEAW